MTHIQNFYEHPPVSGGAPESIVIFLHGLGSNGRDLISLAPLWARDLPNTVFISPDAPFPCDMVPPGYPDSYQWFSLQNRDPHVMLRGVENAAPALQEFIKDQCARFDLPLSKCALVGFSQGTMMSLYVGPRMSPALAGILGYSGALIGDVSQTHKIPVHLVHGMQDDVVPFTAHEAALEILQQNDFPVSGRAIRGLAHSIDQTGLDSGCAFLKGVLGVG